MNRKASFNALTDVIRLFTDEEQVAVVDNAAEFKRFAASLVTKSAESIFFTPFSDSDAMEALVSAGKYDEPTAGAIVSAWRKLAAELGYTGPVVWLVREGFTLKTHAPKAGPCYEDFGYLQDWKLENDEPTRKSLVFFIPYLVAGSKGKNVEEQMALFTALRQRLNLPENHLSVFGSTALLSGLILAHFKRVGERTPLKRDYARTDTLASGGGRLYLGSFDEGGLHCGYWYWSGGHRSSDLGCFALGVEILGS